jgi:hypothetical protein
MKTSLTLDDIHQTIAKADYHIFEGTTLTVCCLTLKDGFTVTGESACVDPANFDAAVGRSIAHQNAVAKIWQLEGYLLNYKLKKGIAQAEDEPPKVASDATTATPPAADIVIAEFTETKLIDPPPVGEAGVAVLSDNTAGA